MTTSTEIGPRDLAEMIERASAQEPIGSPCTGVCKLDASSGLCAGCFRSREEIKFFRTMDDHAKLALFDQLLERRAASQ